MISAWISLHKTAITSGSQGHNHSDTVAAYRKDIHAQSYCFSHTSSLCFLHLNNFFLTIPATGSSEWHIFYNFPTKILNNYFIFPILLLCHPPKFECLWRSSSLCNVFPSLLGPNTLTSTQIFRTRPDRSWGPPSLLYNGYRVFPWGKAAGE